MPTTERSDDPTERLAVARREVRVALTRFVRALRAAGAAVPANAALPGAEALATVGLADRDAVRAALRAALISRREDLPVYDRLFPRFWDALGAALRGETDAESGTDAGAEPDGQLAPVSNEGASSAADAGASDGTESVEIGGGIAPTDDEETRGSESETASERSAAVFSPVGESSPFDVDSHVLTTHAAVEAVEDAVDELTDALASLPGRRTTPATRGRVDARAAMRRSHGTGGVVLDVPRRAPADAAVRGLVLVDVSESVLDTVDRGFLLQFLRALTTEWRAVRTFFFDTAVTEVTAALGRPTPDEAVRALEAAETAWGGGTRIGDAFVTVRDGYPTAVDRRTVVIVVSDGLETGDVSELESGIAWLSRRGRQVFWLNPLAASTAYEPICRGMEAALPYLEGLFAFADVRDLRDMTRQLRRHGVGGPVGYKHDWRDRRQKP